MTPWQSPYSELAAPFLIGVHEFLMGAERWSASYSAITEAVIVRIPKEVIHLVTERHPSSPRANARAGDAPVGAVLLGVAGDERRAGVSGGGSVGVATGAG